MKLYIKTSLVLLVLWCLGTSAKAQTNLPIDLKTVMELSGASNLTIEAFILNQKFAEAKYQKSKEWWLPSIYIGATTHFLHGAAMNGDGLLFTGVNRNNYWSGLGIATEVDFSQGLYQNLVAKQNITTAKLLSVAQKNLIILQAIQAYIDFQSHQAQYILLRNLASRADTLAQQMQVKVLGGLMLQSDYLLAMSNYNHLKYKVLEAEKDKARAAARLSNLLNLEPTVVLVSADTTLFQMVESTNTLTVVFCDARAEFQAMRSELSSLQIERKALNQGLLLPKMRVGFDNGAFGTFSTSPYNTYQLNVSVAWNLPLGRLSYNGDVKQMEVSMLIQQNKMEQFDNQFQLEVKLAQSDMALAQQQINVSKESVQFASEALEQSLARQRLGTAKAFEVFQAQQFYINAQMDYINSVSAYNKAAYALKVARGELL